MKAERCELMRTISEEDGYQISVIGNQEPVFCSRTIYQHELELVLPTDICDRISDIPQPTHY